LDKQKSSSWFDYVDYGIRMAHAFSPKLAAKANFTYMRGTDWYANYDDKTVAGRDRNHVNYDGVNVYGDEVTTNIKGVLLDFWVRELLLRLNMHFNILPTIM
jgi:hypothetical protein